MPTYTASRVSGGNRFFPCKITIDNRGVTLKDPGFFSGEERTIPYSRIASVEISCPLVGYSTIMIESTGEGLIHAHGFTKNEVKEMKRMILDKLNPDE